VKIATEHSEAVGESARISMEEGFLFDGIALHASDIAPRHIELPATIEADLADAGLAIGNGTGVATGKAAHAVAIEFLVQIALAHALIHEFAKRSHIL
jgi:hypothetical protein